MSKTAQSDRPDTVDLSLPAAMGVALDLGDGLDTVQVSAAAGGATQVRLTFTSAEVGNGLATDAHTMTNQDGGLAVRLQLEGGADALTGPVSRFDDEGIRFVSQTDGLTFDVRDLVSGAARGDGFSIVQLGTLGNDRIRLSDETVAVYVNAGLGNDLVQGGSGNDFLVGGGGDDDLRGGIGADSFIGGGGNDMIFGGKGTDVLIANPLTDGADMVNLGDGRDTVNVGGTAQVRLTFTSAEVGNGNASDAGTLLNQDGGLAVRMQTEDGTGALTGGTVRLDDEGIRFVATGAGVTFDVRDLVSGAARGDQFRIAELGSSGGDTLNYTAETGSVYANAGAGNDTLIGSAQNDFLVGGTGMDVLRAGIGNDSLIGGADADRFVFGLQAGNDTIIDFAVNADKIDLVATGVSFDDLTISTTGGITTIGVDFDGGPAADLTITLSNGVLVNESDFIFV